MKTIKTIKKEAIVKIEIGMSFFQKLLSIVNKTSEGLTQEQIQKFKDCISSNKEFTEPWMETISTVSTLIKLIELKAEEQGFVEEVDVESYFANSLGVDPSVIRENLPLNQSPEQPE